MIYIRKMAVAAKDQNFLIIWLCSSHFRWQKCDLGSRLHQNPCTSASQVLVAKSHLDKDPRFEALLSKIDNIRGPIVYIFHYFTLMYKFCTLLKLYINVHWVSSGKKNTRDIQGGLFNFPPPKISKYKKNLEYPNCPPLKSLSVRLVRKIPTLRTF